jgi:hypothetical protein
MYDGAVDAIVAAAGERSGPPEPAAALALTVGVWVCCWGGCPGLPLEAAVQLSSRLGPRRCVGLESINITSPSDAAQLAALLPGLTALGFNLEGFAAGAPPLKLASIITPAARGLRRLTLHGSAPGGWDLDSGRQSGGSGGDGGGAGHASSKQDQPPAAAAAAAAAVPPQLLLAPLSGLTTLALARDWGAHPLPLPPLIPHLASNLLELTVERRRVSRHGELSVLGGLRRLRALTLTLSVQADELLGPPVKWRVFVGTGCSGRRCGERRRCGSGSHGIGGSSSGFSSSGIGSCGVIERDWQCAAVGIKQLHVGGDSAAAAAIVVGEAAEAVPLTASEAGGCDPTALDADLSWMRQLRELRTASLEVPLLDLSWMPSGLEVLDCSKLSDAVTWARCGGCSACCPGFKGISTSTSGGEEAAGRSLSAAAARLPALRMLSLPPLGDDFGEGESEAAEEHSTEDLLLRCIVATCPALEDLDLSAWQVSAQAAAHAAAALRRQLRRLALCAAEGQERQRVAGVVRAVAPGVSLDLLDPPVPVYPWNSVTMS